MVRLFNTKRAAFLIIFSGLLLSSCSSRPTSTYNSQPVYSAPDAEYQRQSLRQQQCSNCQQRYKSNLDECLEYNRAIKSMMVHDAEVAECLKSHGWPTRGRMCASECGS